MTADVMRGVQWPDWRLSDVTFVVVYSRECSKIFVVCCGGRMRWLKTTPECERMLPSLTESMLCVQYDATDFCRVFLLVNCVMWPSFYSRKQIFAAPKKPVLCNTECLSSLRGPNICRVLSSYIRPGGPKFMSRSGSRHKWLNNLFQLNGWFKQGKFTTVIVNHYIHLIVTSL